MGINWVTILGQLISHLGITVASSWHNLGIIMAVNLRFLHHLQLAEEEGDHEGLLLILTLRRRQKRCRTLWMKQWLQRRSMLGQYDTLFQELDRGSERDYMGFTRVDRNISAEVLQRVAPRINKSERCRRPLQPGITWAITLRYLSTGKSYRSLEYNFHVFNSTYRCSSHKFAMPSTRSTEMKFLAYPRTVTNGVHWLEDLGQNGTFITAVELLMENT